MFLKKIYSGLQAEIHLEWIKKALITEFVELTDHFINEFFECYEIADFCCFVTLLKKQGIKREKREDNLCFVLLAKYIALKMDLKILTGY